MLRRDHMRNNEIRRILHFSPVDKWPSSLVWTSPKKRPKEEMRPRPEGVEKKDKTDL